MKQRYLFPLLMAIVMMAMSPQRMWAETKDVSTYDELVTALAAANDDDVINLTADITVSGALKIGKKVTFQGQKLTVGSDGSVLASAQVTFKNAVEASKIKQNTSSYKGQLRYTASGNRMIFQGAVESKTISGGLFKSGATISTDLVDGGTFNNGIIPKPRTEGDKILKGGTFYTRTGSGLVEIYNMLGEGYELFANIASTNYISIKEAGSISKTAKITRTSKGNGVTLYSKTLTDANSFAVSGDVIELIAEDNSNITLADGVTFKVPTALSYTGTVSSGVEGKFVLSKTDDGYTTYSLADEVTSVSKVGVTTIHASLKEAFASLVSGDNAQVVLLKDDASAVATLAAGVTATLDLNGKTFSNSITNNGNLTLVDNAAGGKIEYNGVCVTNAASSSSPYSEFTLTSGQIVCTSTANKYAIKNNHGKCTISGGSITAENAGAITTGDTSSSPTELILNGGTIKGTGTDCNGAIYAQYGAVTYNAGTIESNSEKVDIYFYDGTLNETEAFTSSSITTNLSATYDGGTTKVSLLGAFNKAESTIQLFADVNLTTSFNVKKNLTLNLNGHNITSTTAVFRWGNILSKNASLTIEGEGVVTAGSGMSTKTVGNIFRFDYPGTLVINGGTYVSGRDVKGNENEISLIAVDGCTVTINGGTFKNMKNGQVANSKYMLNILDAVATAHPATRYYEVKGGTFYGFNPAVSESETETTNLVSEGYCAKETAEGSGIWVVSAAAATVTSSSVTTGYSTFAEALAAATDGSTIKLYQDVTIQNSSYAILIDYDKYPTAGLTIDLGQKTLTLERTGMYGSEAINIWQGNKITIKNGTLDVNKYGVGINAVSPLTLDGVTVDGTDLDQTIMGPCEKTLCTIQSKGTDVVLNNSIITAPSGQYSYYSGNYSDGNALTLNGTSKMDGNINLHDCIMKAENTATITNCTLYADDNSVGALSINDGTFTAPAGYNWKAVTDGLSLLYSSALSLNDKKDPTSTLQALVAANAAQDLTLTGRTLYKDGYYNTLCLPFALTATELAADNCPLKGCTLKEVTGASLNTETNTMTIQLTDVTALEAGKPYLIKWANDTENPTITNPTFTGVTITKSEPSTITGTNLDVVGIFAPQLMKYSDTDLFFLGAENKFYTSNSESGANLKGYRCFFKQKSANPAKALNFVLDDDGATGISELRGESLELRGGKYLENGRVVIMRNGQKYNVNGQVIK